MELKQVSLLEQLKKSRWPAPERFPLNLSESKVEDILRQDIRASGRYIIVTGYSSLEHLITFFGQDDFPNREITILLGHELDLSDDSLHPWPSVDLSTEIKEYWLSRGISILLCGALLRFLADVQQGQIRFRLGERLHAKIYFGETHAILGSSNFSRAGLCFQKEANCRFYRDDPRYQDLKLIVDNFIAESRDYQAEIISLLESLLYYTTWQEVLAYAVLQILGDDWLAQHKGLNTLLSRLKLWPSQRQAVAQALWVLDNHGSVLIADPTGAGKTKVGLALLWALQHRLWLKQEFGRARCFVICPPGVKDQWEEEAVGEDVPFLPEVISQGLLSIAQSEARGKALEKIRQANILLIDEAHNYLSRQSRRSQTIQFSSLAEHIILMTATPINRGMEDLLRLMEVLGLDNLSDEALQAYQQMRREIESKGRLSPTQYQRLKRYVQLFTVRRTKRELNRLIEQNPEAYRDRFGRPCRFPKEISRLYPTEESESDRALARQIEDLSYGLKGLIWLKKTLEELWQGKNFPDPQFLTARLVAAPALARFNIKAMLRSSRAALVEHIYGTEKAQEIFGIQGKIKHSTGNILARLASWKEKTKELFRPIRESHEVPEWLKDKEAFRQALLEEQEIYKKIAQLACQISDKRERGKIRFVRKLFKRHKLVLAYDSRLITLAYLQRLWQEMAPEIASILVTGARRRERRLIKRLFCLGSEQRNVLALCSDAVAEGVNLQQASAVVFFDLPSVIRIAEQRIGRIERLDSPHHQVEIYWPNDSPEFCVSTDRRLVERHLLVENILGSNINIPDEFLNYAKEYREEHISGRLMLELYERERLKAEVSFWDELPDVFQSVKELIEGESPLVSQEALRSVKDLSKRGAVLISVVSASTPWCFLCLRGERKNEAAPKWVYLERNQAPLTDILEICRKLRRNLEGKSPSTPWNDEVEDLLKEFLLELQKAELCLLPARRKRALELLKDVLRFYLRTSKEEKRRDIVKRLIYLLENHASENVDLYHFSQIWLDLLAPRFKEYLNTRCKRRPLLLKDLRQHLRQFPLEDTELAHLLERIQTREPLDKRIIACILGYTPRA